jgi:GntR family transcriptional regulator
MTARAAVTQVVQAGLAYRVPGRGTFVAAPDTPRRADHLVRFSAEIRSRGRRPSSRVIAALRRAASPRERARLRLNRLSDVIDIERVRLADDEPVVLERAVFPAAMSALLDADLVHGSLHEAVVAAGRTPTRGSATLTAELADVDDAAILGIPVGSPLLVEYRLILDENENPLELTESRYIASRYRLTVAFSVEPPPGHARR